MNAEIVREIDVFGHRLKARVQAALAEARQDDDRAATSGERLQAGVWLLGLTRADIHCDRIFAALKEAQTKAPIEPLMAPAPATAAATAAAGKDLPGHWRSVIGRDVANA
jgi:hypothetical protein